MHPAALPPAEFCRDVSVVRTRAGGPGGQRRNKVETAARARHEPTGLAAEANERRDFEQNRRVALARLRWLVAWRHREPVELAHTRPSELWVRRAVSPTFAVSAEHDDGPTLLAEALDVLVAADDDVAVAAGALGVTPSRLIKVLKLHPRALTELNHRLERRGRRAWR